MEEALTWLVLTLAFAWMVSKLVAIVTDFQQGQMSITRSEETKEEEAEDSPLCERKGAEDEAKGGNLATSIEEVADEEWETTDLYLSTMETAERSQVMEKEKTLKGDNRQGLTTESSSVSAGVEGHSQPFPSASISLLDGSYCQVYGGEGNDKGGPESRGCLQNLKEEGEAATSSSSGEFGALPVSKDVESPSKNGESTLEAGAKQTPEVPALPTEGPATGIAIKDVEDVEDGDWEGVEAGELEEEFDAAATFVAAQAMGHGGMNISQDIQLQLYSLYKQATVGPCSAPQPSVFNITARTKWDVWRKLEKMEPEEAMGRYIGTVTQAFPDWSTSQDSSTAQDADPSVKSSGKGAEEASRKFGPVFSSLAGGGEDEHQKTREPILKLHESAQEGDLSGLLELLQSKVASVNDVDDEGCTALHLSADRGHVAVVNALVNAGSDVNAKDALGQTPLHYACTCEYKDVAEALVKAGADPLAKDNEGATPASICASSWNLAEMKAATST